MSIYHTYRFKKGDNVVFARPMENDPCPSPYVVGAPGVIKKVHRFRDFCPIDVRFPDGSVDSFWPTELELVS